MTIHGANRTINNSHGEIIANGLEDCRYDGVQQGIDSKAPTMQFTCLRTGASFNARHYAEAKIKLEKKRREIKPL